MSHRTDEARRDEDDAFDKSKRVPTALDGDAAKPNVPTNIMLTQTVVNNGAPTLVQAPTSQPVSRIVDDILDSDLASPHFMLVVLKADVRSFTECVNIAANAEELRATSFPCGKAWSECLYKARDIVASDKSLTLSPDEVAAIYLYTSERFPLYKALNKALRTHDEGAINAFLPYLRLLLTALYKLPLEDSPVYRGVTCDLNDTHPEHKELIWWQFSSTSIDEATCLTFLGDSGPRTKFCIKARAVNISRFSEHSRENERLMLPSTRVRVAKKSVSESGVVEIELDVVKAGAPLIDYSHPMFFCDVSWVK